MKHREALTAMAVTILMLAPSAAMPAMAATANVDLTVDNKFAPANPTIAVGDTVKFTWGGGFHDVKFADGVSSGAPKGDVGATYSRTFDAAGSFGYVCTVHEAMGMVGTITVQAAAAGAGSGSGSASGSASGSGSGSGSGSALGDVSGAAALPHTGPESSLLPLAGGALIIAAALMRRRRRRPSPTGS